MKTNIFVEKQLKPAIDVNCDETTDLKLQNQKFIEAKNVLTEVIARMKSDYIKNFASILAKGVVELEVNYKII